MTTRTQGTKLPVLFAVIGRFMPGSGYHEPSAQDAPPAHPSLSDSRET